MTVNELIVELQKLPQDLVVVTRSCNDYDVDELNGTADVATQVTIEPMYVSIDYPDIYVREDYADTMDTNKNSCQVVVIK